LSDDQFVSHASGVSKQDNTKDSTELLVNR